LQHDHPVLPYHSLPSYSTTSRSYPPWPPPGAPPAAGAAHSWRGSGDKGGGRRGERRPPCCPTARSCAPWPPSGAPPVAGAGEAAGEQRPAWLTLTAGERQLARLLSAAGAAPARGREGDGGWSVRLIGRSILSITVHYMVMDPPPINFGRSEQNMLHLR
jgi:hypothetical protein